MPSLQKDSTLIFFLLMAKRDTKYNRELSWWGICVNIFNNTESIMFKKVSRIEKYFLQGDPNICIDVGCYRTREWKGKS